MSESESLQIAISTITGILVPKIGAEKIIEVWELIKADPNSTTIKEIKERGCSCYGSNAMHPCFCK